MARGRPKKDTVQVTFRLNFDYLQQLKLLNPQLLTRDPATNEPKFRHGALGRYLERLIREDLEKREEFVSSQPHINLDELMKKDKSDEA